MSQSDLTSERADAVRAGLVGRCPRCGKGRLFDGFLSVRERCAACGLDLRFADSGDGPAFFVMTIIGFVVVALALWVEVAMSPSLWVHLALWLPLTLVLSLALLRPLKGLMLALQYRHSAREGAIDRG